ncbi:hypothetical protein C623_0219890 [Bacillus thuringiensis serovar aizawai str. Hu4-2]|nr:hypothetical protein C623_0219890 [Bacillus thuringiensis serovar aizawai str. Hu4-2]
MATRDVNPVVIFSFMITAIVFGFVVLCYAEVVYTFPVWGILYTYTCNNCGIGSSFIYKKA